MQRVRGVRRVVCLVLRNVGRERLARLVEPPSVDWLAVHNFQFESDEKYLLACTDIPSDVHAAP